MKIRTITLVTMVVSMTATIAAAWLLLAYLETARVSIAHEKLTAGITRTIYQLTLLAHEIDRFRLSRVQRQWHIRHGELADLLEQMQTVSRHHPQQLQQLQSDYEKLDEIFTALMENAPHIVNSENPVPDTLLRRVTVQLTTRAQNMIDLANTMQEEHQNLMERAIEQTIRLTIAAATVLLMAMGLLWMMIRKRLVDPVARMQRDLQTLSSGSLDHRLRGFHRDEIGEIAAAINAMSIKLQIWTDRLERTMNAAEVANRAKSLFLSNMSHELRTPLNAILGFSQIMERDATLSPEHREELGIIRRSGSQLLALINDILEISHIDVDQTHINRSNFDLHDFLNDIDEMIRVRAEEKELIFNLEIDADTPRYIQTDAGKLRQVLFNMLGNAIKFTDHGRIDLRVGLIVPSPKDGEPPPPSWLSFEVIDTGPGIADADLEMLFDPFMRIQSGMATHDGAGLGLPISKKFIELLGGTVSVESTPGTGARFCFDIPVETVDGGDVQTRGPFHRVVGLQPDQQSWRLLVVEDKGENRFLLARLLSSVGFQVREAADGREGIERCLEWHPHLVFMDMRMPVMDGIEATGRIKAHDQCHSTMVIAITASVFDGDRSRILAAGCEDVIRKPFREEEIFEVLNRHLGVRFVHEAAHRERGPEKPAAVGEHTLTPAIRTALPEPLRDRLQHAVLELNVEEAMAVIDSVRNEEPSLAETLHTLVDHFQFDKIQTWLESREVS